MSKKQWMLPLIHLIKSFPVPPRAKSVISFGSFLVGIFCLFVALFATDTDEFKEQFISASFFFLTLSAAYHQTEPKSVSRSENKPNQEHHK